MQFPDDSRRYLDKVMDLKLDKITVKYSLENNYHHVITSCTVSAGYKNIKSASIIQLF